MRLLDATRVASSPYAFPFDGNLAPSNTALLIIDMQVDFCTKGGYVDRMGYDLSAMQTPIEPIRAVLDACRAGGWHVLHTREGHRPDLSDCPDNKKWRSEQIGAGIGSTGPQGRILVRGEPGWEIIPDLAPIDGEPVIDKPGKGCFRHTDLDLLLRKKGVTRLVLAGVTTDVCVHTTMRDANDLGYECLLLSDCTAATDPANHEAACSMVQKQGGVFGAVATSKQLLEAMAASCTAGFLTPPPVAGPCVKVTTALPYAYTLPLKSTALVMIDFQRDFMCEGGFASTLGNNVQLLRGSLPKAKQLLAACRAAGLHVVHTLEAHLPNLSDLHRAKHERGRLEPGLRIGDVAPAGQEAGRILVRNEPGNGIVEELLPIAGEKVLHKPGKGAFYNTDLTEHLAKRGITHLLFAGVTTEVCVQTSMREANDRGFDCLIVTDATASYFPHFHTTAIEMIVAQGGIVGWAADTAAVAAALATADRSS